MWPKEERQRRYQAKMPEEGKDKSLWEEDERGEGRREGERGEERRERVGGEVPEEDIGGNEKKGNGS